MGVTTPKSALERRYREAARDWLVSMQAKQGLDTQAKLGRAMGRDRTTALRYLNMSVAPDFTVLMALADSLGEELPHDLVAAFHRAEGREPPTPGKRHRQTVAANDAGEAPSASASGVARETIRRMPIISSVAAGRLADPSTQIRGEHQTIEISGLPPGDYFATRVRGTSMNRVSPPGSLIIVNRADRELIRGRRYIFARRGETTYKRFETEPLRLEPETFDPEGNPIIFPKSEEEWEVIGRVRMTVVDDL